MTKAARPANDTPASPARVRVLLPIQGLDILDYSVPEKMALTPGDIVRVPLGPREVHGVVWDPELVTTPLAPAHKLKPVIAHVPLPGLAAAHRRFIAWVAGYYLAAPNTVLRMAMSVPAALEPPPLKTLYRRSSHRPNRLTEKRAAVLDALGPSEALPVKELATRAEVTDGLVRALIAASALEAVAMPADAPYAAPDPTLPGPVLTAEQAAAAAALRQAVAACAFAPCLLEGVTGAGKTEVYFEAIAAALARDPVAQVLVLLPEIALTTQWLTRFQARFGASPVEWHSDLAVSERRRAWRSIIEGRARVVVGARSALFLPFQNLSLIVVDEEHDPSFKQEDGLAYNARDMAVVRGQLTGVPVVLASATPSLETLQNCADGRYRHLKLATRHGEAQLPEVTVIDMRRGGPGAGRWVSPALHSTLSETLAAGEQALLFLNRRGYAPLTLCRACGERLECPNCSTWLVEHRLARRLMCHHCGHSRATPTACPACGVEDSLVACGPGVERLAEEVRSLFPAARLLEATSDTLSSPARAAAAVAAIDAGEVDVIVGTQLVTKGYHFPNLTLVGVIDADLGLAGGDLRAAERTFQQLTQAAGRAGRAERPGRVFIQTHMPENPVMRALASGDKDAFIARESEARRQRAMPPFGRLAAVIVSGPDEAAVAAAGRALARTAPRTAGVIVLGPAPAPLAVLRGRHRHRLLVKAERDINLQRVIADWLARAPRASSVRLALDIDPYSFL